MRRYADCGAGRFWAIAEGTCWNCVFARHSALARCVLVSYTGTVLAAGLRMKQVPVTPPNSPRSFSGPADSTAAKRFAVAARLCGAAGDDPAMVECSMLTAGAAEPMGSGVA
jgi:hypothetical protein